MSLQHFPSPNQHHTCSLGGGELFDYCVEQDYLVEGEAICFLRQILDGLQYMHKKMICHLDLKVACNHSNYSSILVQWYTWWCSFSLISITLWYNMSSATWGRDISSKNLLIISCMHPLESCLFGSELSPLPSSDCMIAVRVLDDEKQIMNYYCQSLEVSTLFDMVCQ